MPRNGAGTYSLPESPFVFDTVISETAVNSNFSDIGNSLTGSVAADGQTPRTANSPMSGYKHTGVTATSGSGSRTEYTSGGTTQDNVIMDAGLTTGSSTVYAATLSPAITAYVDKACYRVQFDEACGSSPTINFNTVGAKKIYKNVGGVATQLAANDVPANFVGILRYDTALDTAAGGFWLINNAGVSSSTITSDNLAASAIQTNTNLGIVASVAANALTISIKGEDGNDPSSTNVVKIPFADQAGNYDVLSITAATSLVVSSGSTLGTTNAVLARLWVVGFNDSGTFRLGIVNTQTSTGVFALQPDLTYSSTAEGGAGAADSAGVIYTSSAVTTKPMVILGYLEATEATAGTWATSPSKVVVWKPGMKVPGDVVQVRYNVTGAYSSGSTIINYDDTIPQQSAEGTQFMTQAITPTSAANYLIVESSAQYGGPNGNFVLISAMFRDSTEDAVSVNWWRVDGPTGQSCQLRCDYVVQARTTSSTTFKIKGGVNVAGTIEFNGAGGGRLMGGAAGSSMYITEIFA